MHRRWLMYSDHFSTYIYMIQVTYDAHVLDPTNKMLKFAAVTSIKCNPGISKVRQALPILSLSPSVDL